METIKFIVNVTGVFVWLLILYIFIVALVKTIKNQIQTKRIKKESLHQLNNHPIAKCYCGDCINFGSASCYLKIPPNVDPEEWFCASAIPKE